MKNDAQSVPACGNAGTREPGEMVERVALAIRSHCVCIWGAPHLYAVILGEKWDEPILKGLSCEQAHIEAAKLNARAAIEAMRLATEVMYVRGDE